MKKILAMALVLCMIFALSVTAHADDTIKIGMVTDVGGVNDQSFNQFAWAGLQNLAKEDPSFEVNYLESKTDADYQTNINTFIDEDYDLIITVGYMLADATREAALDNPDVKFAIIDDATNADPWFQVVEVLSRNGAEELFVVGRDAHQGLANFFKPCDDVGIRQASKTDCNFLLVFIITVLCVHARCCHHSDDYTK